jgi:DNA repair protein RecO (recombination protein O)
MTVGLYRDQGVVLRSIRLGEADRIVSFITEGRGKVRAVAKGVRKTKSRFGARLEPTVHVSLLLYEGRELDIVTQAEAIDHFRAIREDLDRLTRATQMLEAVDQVVQERHANVALYQMLVGALRALAARDAPLMVPAFFWKLLSLEGFHPLLDACAECGATDDLVAFDLGHGGVLCRSCGRGAMPLSPDALDLIRRVLGGGLAPALNEPAGPATDEVAHLATSALEHHLERRLRSVALLDRA